MAESEESLIAQARDAVSQCNWIVGECASRWTEKYARGRTDHDFGQLVGLSGDQIYQRRRVWMRFGAIHERFPNLKWSFFYVALNWDDAEECLTWASETSATVAEMRAWRRARHGEDLTAEPEETYSEWAAPLIVDTATTPLTAVVDPAEFVPSGQGDRAGLPSAAENAPETLTAAARESGDYAPFRSGAASPPPSEQPAEVAVLERPEPDPDQVWKRTAALLERVEKQLTPQVMQAFSAQPDRIRNRITAAFDRLKTTLEDVLND